LPINRVNITSQARIKARSQQMDWTDLNKLTQLYSTHSSVTRVSVTTIQFSSSAVNQPLVEFHQHARELDTSDQRRSIPVAIFHRIEPRRNASVTPPSAICAHGYSKLLAVAVVIWFVRRCQSVVSVSAKSRHVQTVYMSDSEHRQCLR